MDFNGTKENIFACVSNDEQQQQQQQPNQCFIICSVDISKINK